RLFKYASCRNATPKRPTKPRAKRPERPIRKVPTRKRLTKVTKAARPPRRKTRRQRRRKNPIKLQNGRVRPRCRTMSSSKPNESNLLLCPRKRRKIDNTPLRYGSKRRASFTSASQKACVRLAITDWRK